MSWSYLFAYGLINLKAIRFLVGLGRIDITIHIFLDIFWSIILSSVGKKCLFTCLSSKHSRILLLPWSIINVNFISLLSVHIAIFCCIHVNTIVFGQFYSRFLLLEMIYLWLRVLLYFTCNYWVNLRFIICSFWSFAMLHLTINPNG